MFEPQVYKRRRVALRGNFKNGILVFIGNKEEPFNYSANNYRFRQDSSFLYFFGPDHPDLAAIIDIESATDTLYGNNPHTDDAIWSGKGTSIAEIAAKAGMHGAESFSELTNVIKQALQQKREIHFVAPYRASVQLFLSELLGVKPMDLQLLKSEKLIRAIVALRSKKEAEEISEIEGMVNVAGLMHTAAMRMAKAGTAERKIAATMEGLCLEYGYAVSFPIICSVRGEVLHNPHYNNVLKEGQLLLTDAGAESFHHYASDITRTTPIDGRFTKQQKEIYQIVLNANLKVFELVKPGMLYRDIHFEAAYIISQGLIDLGLMKGDAREAVMNGAHALFFPHGTGHMLGLDVHDMENLGENFVGYDAEVSRSKQFGLAYLRMARCLHEGFVLTNEPGIYFIPELINRWESEKLHAHFINYNKVKTYIGFGGIRIEDNLLVTANGCRLLGKPIPKNIHDVEMACV